MLLTRWKLMAGVLGVSIGGLAAAASQCPKLDKTKGRQPEAPATAEAPKLPPAGPPSAPVLPLPVPSAPQLAPVGVAPPAIPDAKPLALPAPPAPATPSVNLPAAPTSGSLTLPDFPAPTTEPKAAKPDAPKAAPAGLMLPAIPDMKPVAEAPKVTTPPMTPPKPVAEAPKALPTADLVPPVAKPAELPSIANTTPPSKPTATSPVVPISGAQPVPELPSPGKPSSAAAPALPLDTPVVNEVPPSKPTAAPTEAGTVKVGAVKYRILLRVGEGEPTFEVKSGDDLVLKVACEKVDIKSPEKGAAGLSAVTARGKVRFAGFGVEGTCDELSFMAGTGEVSMSGEVKVQMKDKLGRVESELSTSTLKYKIDASAVGASIKP